MTDTAPGPRHTTAVSRDVAASPDHVFAVLADGWLLPVWLVGAAHIRNADTDWPARGARVHHSIGAWPMLITDTTEVLDVDPPHTLVLHARMWPLGEAHVEMRMRPSSSGTAVTMIEGAARGPAWLLDNPLQRLWLRRRNLESLARLAAVAENREGQR
jgi:uncharacterized protein YndB with AHSA1/START domain